jgi:hypothetical protein
LCLVATSPCLLWTFPRLCTSTRTTGQASVTLWDARCIHISWGAQNNDYYPNWGQGFEHLPDFVCDINTTYCGPNTSSICVVLLPAYSLYIVQRKRCKLPPPQSTPLWGLRVAIRNRTCVDYIHVCTYLYVRLGNSVDGLRSFELESRKWLIDNGKMSPLRILPELYTMVDARPV